LLLHDGNKQKASPFWLFSILFVWSWRRGRVSAFTVIFSFSLSRQAKWSSLT
jgi:hypothetical protein